MKKGEVDSKMMSGLLTGVNRAFPYAKCKTVFFLSISTETINMKRQC